MGDTEDDRFRAVKRAAELYHVNPIVVLYALQEAGLAPEYVKTCLQAYREGEISYGKLADALLVSPINLPSVVSDLGFDVSRASETP